jgi:hypothetical protein
MNDKDIVRETYADALKNLYGVLLDGLIQAQQDQTAQNQAKQRFSSGLAVARKARDAALSLL